MAKKKVKKVAKERKLFGISVIDRGYCEVTRERDENDKWDNDDLCYSHNIVGIKLNEDRYGDLTLGFEPKEDEAYYLLYAIYSTGDSFHHEDGCIVYVDLYRTRAEAKENAKLMEEHYRNSGSHKNDYESRYSVKLKNHEGNEFVFHCPYVGYFEDLTSIEVEAVLLK